MAKSITVPLIAGVFRTNSVGEISVGLESRSSSHAVNIPSPNPIIKNDLSILDIPLMLLCSKLNYSPFYGAIFSSIIGLGLSTFLALRKLKKEYQLNYCETYKIFYKILGPTVIMSFIVIVLKSIMPNNLNNKGLEILNVGLISFVGGFSYLYLLYKNKVLDKVFGKNYLSKIIKKLLLVK